MRVVLEVESIISVEILLRDRCDNFMLIIEVY